MEIYSSKKKSLLILLASLAFVVGGIYMFMNAEDFTGQRERSPFFIKAIGIVSVLFFGLGIYVAIRQLLANQLILIIDENGINVNPKKSLTEYIQWKNISGFSELKIHNQKFVVIDVDNPDYWIEKEENGIRKKLMRFNVSNYGSPFNLSATATQMNHAELLKTLTEYLERYRNG